MAIDESIRSNICRRCSAPLPVREEKRGRPRVFCDTCRRGCSGRSRWGSSERACEFCKVLFYGRPTRRFCSNGCARRKTEHYRTPLPVKACAFCCVGFIPSHKERRLCSMVCSHRNQSTLGEQPCGVCGAPFRPRLNKGIRQRFCSLRCGRVPRMALAKQRRKRQRAEYQEQRRAALSLRVERQALARAERTARRLAHRVADHNRLQLACRQCGNAIPASTKGRRRSRYCSTRCSRRASTRRSRLRSRPGKKHTSRARKIGVPYRYDITPKQVYDRDRWRCQLCGGRVLRRLFGTNHEDGPSIDHIVPLSAQGSPGHVWSNVQCAHRRCNSAKGARPSGQLRLV
jgi:5-methylcytosine-specific restriction endonuclease McrA